jgi:hypothetical protein
VRPAARRTSAERKADLAIVNLRQRRRCREVW